ACKEEAHYHDYTERFKWDWNSARYMLRDAEQRNLQRQKYLSSAYGQLHPHEVLGGPSEGRTDEEGEGRYHFGRDDDPARVGCAGNLPRAAGNFAGHFQDSDESPKAQDDRATALNSFGEDPSRQMVDVVAGGEGEEGSYEQHFVFSPSMDDILTSDTPTIPAPTESPLSSSSAFITSYPAVLLALGLMLLAWLVTIYNCFQHLLNYSREDLQMHIIRIVLVAPLYASGAFLAVCLSNVDLAVLLESIPEIWEAVVVYSFFCLILTYVGGEHNWIQS
ncbi:hypothetical protein FOZ63_009585, partial [Perkinsus olseni]